MNSLDDTDSWSAPLDSGSRENKSWIPARVTIDAAGMSHQGFVRSNNEDHFLISRFGRFFESVASNLSAVEVPARHEATGNAFMVADGLGGHAAGETASKSALQIFIQLVVDTPDWILRYDEPQLSTEIERRAEERLAQVSQTMTRLADSDGKLRGFGTTLTVVWGLGERWFVAHVGDSRAYLFRHSTLQQLTCDHTVAQALADTGVIDADHRVLRSLRNRLTRMLGDRVQQIVPQIRSFNVEHGDTLLICSDGLTDMIDDYTIAELLAAQQPAAECSRRLIDAALEAGGADNVTAIVARIALEKNAELMASDARSAG